MYDDVRFCVYNKEDVYRNEITPLFEKIQKICDENKLPFFCVVAYKNDNNGTAYGKFGGNSGTYGCALSVDRISEVTDTPAGTEPRTFEKSEVLTEQLKPIFDKVEKLCMIHTLPFVGAVAYEENKETTKYSIYGHGAGAIGVELKENLFHSITRVLCGLDLKSAGAVLNIEQNEDYVADAPDDGVFVNDGELDF